MSSNTSRLNSVSSILITTILLMSSVAGMQLVSTAAAATPSHPVVLSQASTPLGTSPLATSGSSGSVNASSLDWTESTGPGVTGTQGWDYSPQTQINASSVSTLQTSYLFPVPSIWNTVPDWQGRFPGLQYSLSLEGTQAPVVTSQGVGYVVTNGLSVYAIDLSSGKLLSADYPTMDWGAYAKTPFYPGGPPGHLHGVNMADGIIWVPGFGCQLQGWDATSGVLRANLTQLCYNIPGDKSPYAGWGAYYPYGDNAIQVDVASNVILYNIGASAEGTGGGRMFIEGCSLSAALDPSHIKTGDACTAKGGACTTPAGGVCSAGSGLLWRTFMMPAIDGSTPNFSTNICNNARVWIGGVPCSSLPASLIQNDWQYPAMSKAWNGTNIGPSSGMSNTWGNYALDDATGMFFVGTSQTGPDWNATYRPGPNLMGDSIVGMSLTNGSIIWADKTIPKDLNDYDCDLNVILAQVNSQKMILKACKSGIVYGINALSGQPDWVLDTGMPNPATLGSSTSPLSQPFECQANNVTSCDVGAVWDKIYHMYDNGKGTLKMQGTNPHPHGYIALGPYRASTTIDPLNNTEMTQFICPIGTNAQCQALAGVGNTLGCPEFVTNGSTLSCPSLGQQGKAGFIEGRYFMESENAFDGKYFYITVMDGPMEHDYISNVQFKGTSGLTFDTDLYFAGKMSTNATVLALDPSTGKVVWNYTRPIYYRGGLLVTGGMLVTQWPDGHLIFLDSATGSVIRDMNFGVPLLAPMSIAPDINGVEHLLISYGGTQHQVLGEIGLHGPLGHGYIIPGAIISLTLGPSPTGSNTGGTVVVNGGSTLDVYSYAFYALVATVVILAVIAGAMVVTRKRVGPGVAPT
jgi:hypothetical protein